jgi:uncharacterized membrane protein YecN with MAPEG domain
MPPVITALYGALNAVFNIALAYRVSRMRAKHSVSIGTGTNDQLAIAVRQHANNAEYLPLALVMLLICELCGGDRVLLHVIGGGLLAGRVAHAVGLPGKQWNVWRFSGSALTYVGILGSAGYALYLRFTV